MLNGEVIIYSIEFDSIIATGISTSGQA